MVGSSPVWGIFIRSTTGSPKLLPNLLSEMPYRYLVLIPCHKGCSSSENRKEEQIGSFSIGNINILQYCEFMIEGYLREIFGKLTGLHCES